MGRTTQSLYFTGPRELDVRAESLPDPGRDEVLVEAIVSGISAGTELNVFRGYAPQWRQRMDPATRLFLPTDDPDWKWPARYGYTMVGRVAERGSAVTRVREGDLVFSYSPHGRHAIVAADAVVPLGALADPELGAFFANFNTAYNGVLDAAIPLGADVVVSGLGVIGQLVTRLVRRAGARRIIGVDRLAPRREAAMAGGATHVLDPADGVAETVRELTAGRGADVVIEVSGAAPALNEAIRTAGYNGTVVAMSWYGGTFESLHLSGEFHHNRTRIISSQVGAVNPMLGPMWSVARRGEIVRELIDLYAADLRGFITHRIALAEAGQGYRLLDQGAPDVLQIIIDYRK